MSNQVSSEALRLIQYLGFKMDCLLEQEALKIKIDLPRVQKNFDELTKLQEEKTSDLSKAMPKKVILKEYNKPKGIYKKDGSFSEAGKKWFALLQEQKLPETTVGPINVIMGYQDGNPGSHIQVKEWLYSLGWKPDVWKYVKDKTTGEERKIEQVLDDGLLSQSVIDLKEVDPTVGILEGLSIIQHRLSIFKGFLENNKGGFVVASASGLTNTLRFKHRAPIVNLPKVDKPYGEEIRGCLIAPEGYTLCGADMVSLEDTTKRHYMQPFDPEYVKEMSEPGFDPHLNLARFAGAVNQQDIDNHNSGKVSLKALRHKFKQANYSAVYGIGAPKLARAIGGSVKEAKALLEAYWKRNHAVLKAVEHLEVKVTGPHMWLKNPVSGFWYQLRSEKDKFSTLNQSTGVYAFDTWLYYCRAGGAKVVLQMHDEIGAYVINGGEEDNTRLLKSAIDKTNDKLKLNVKLDIDIKYGSNYAATH